MAIPTTYTELKTEIANWLKRNDLTNDIATFIELGEQRINNEDSIIFQEATATITTTSNQDYSTLPTGFKEVRTLTYSSSNYCNPVKVDLASLENYRNNSVTGIPSYFAVSKSNFEWDVKADAAYDLVCEYYKAWDIASDSTNYLLTNFSGVYLFAALEEAAVFIRHPQLNVWRQKASEAIERFKRNSSVRGRSELRVDSGLTYNYARSNILTGQ